MISLLLSAALAGSPTDTLASPQAVPALSAEISARASERGVAPDPLVEPVADAATAGLPVEIVAAKVLEGLAKGAPPERVAAVAKALVGRLADARALLDEARDAKLPLLGSRPAALADLAAALAEGVPRDALRALVKAAKDARGGSADAVVAAARTMGELTHRGVAPDAALPLGIALASRPPVQAGVVAALFDACRAEGGSDPQPFLDEAARRTQAGEPLTDLVDFFGDSSDHVVKGNEHGGAASQATGRGHAKEPGVVQALDEGPHGKAKGKSK